MCEGLNMGKSIVCSKNSSKTDLDKFGDIVYRQL